MKLFYFTSILLLITGKLVAQQPTNVTVASCAGQVICVAEKDSLFDLCVKVKIPAGHCKIAKFTLKWGDFKSDEFTQTIDYSKETEIEKHHIYDLRYFAKNCEYQKEYYVEIQTVNEGCSQLEDRNISPIVIKNFPRARFQVPDICEGKNAYFSNNSCPGGNDMTYTWKFGDGNSSSNSNPNHLFSTTQSTYPVTLTVKNSCGVSEITQDIKLRKTPVPKIVTAGFSVVSGDTVMCLENGGIITLDASGSQDQTGIQWSLSGGNYSFVQNTNQNSLVAKVQLRDNASYTVTLTAINSCSEATKRLLIRAFSKPNFSITHTESACQPIPYKLTNPHPDAKYFINGEAIKPGEEKQLGFSDKPYVITAELPYACGVFKPKADTFYVQSAQAAAILTKDSTFCAGASRFLIPVNTAGGTWGGHTGLLETQNSQTYFNPKTAGTYQLTYALGKGTCASSAQVTFTVAGVSATATSLAACQGTTSIRLQGSPQNGVWTTSDCFNCIKGDTLLLSGNSPIRLTYEVTGTAGCKANAQATVQISNPKAAFTLASACSGVVAKPLNQSTGAVAYQWFVNGAEAGTAASPSLMLPAGTVTVRLVAGSGDCKNEASTQVVVTAPPASPKFTPTVRSGCSPLPVSFAAADAERTDVSYHWSFGNGSESSVHTPASQIFSNQSTSVKRFLVKFSVKNSCGSLEDTLSIAVKPLVKATIGLDSTTIRCSPARIKFSNRSVGVQGTSVWNFGDGSPAVTSASDTLSHLFSARDSLRAYRVKLLVKNECGEDQATADVKVYPVHVKSLFTMSHSQVCPGTAVKFTDATVPLANQWFWQFGDEGVSYEQNPTFRFKKPQSSYTITLVATTPCGYDSTRKTLLTTIQPTGSFRLDSLACIGQPINLRNTSNPASISGFVWDFGDGSKDSSQFNPQHAYQSGGMKTVTLTLKGSPGTCLSTPIQRLVTIRSKPTAAFRIGKAYCSSVPVSLENQSTDATDYRWYVNGQARSTEEKPRMLLPPGYHQISLVASIGKLCQDSTAHTDIVHIDSCWVSVPEAFTPDGRGPATGERLTVFGKGVPKVASFRIINRWGNSVFQQLNFEPNDISLGWDGRDTNGHEQPEDLYRYELIYSYGTPDDNLKKMGTLYLLRGKRQ